MVDPRINQPLNNSSEIPISITEEPKQNASGDFSSWTKEELIDEIKKLRKRKKYGIIWEEKKETVVEDCRNKLPVLKEVTESLQLIKNSLINVLIEGDNYHALSVLNYTFPNSIDLIIIDPPYNTGKGQFVYNDRRIDENDQYRHSKWLSFMDKRLKLSRNLLSETGVILISIDETEYAQLKLLCDEIFGETNYIGTFVWRKKNGAGSDSKFIFIQHEYVIFYSKDVKNLDNFYEPLTEEQKKEYKNPDNDPRGLWAPTDLTAPSSDKDDSRLYEVISPYTGKKWLKRWSYTQENMEALIADNLVWFGKHGDAIPKRKRFLSDKLGLVPRSILDFTQTSDGKKDLEKFFGIGSRVFDYPKPVKLIKHLIRMTSKKDSIVLDFFAGSGTTGQAVMELNEEDKGGRRFILCTNDENNICKDVCYPRIKKVIDNYQEKFKSAGLINSFSLKYYRTDFVDAVETDSNKKKLVNSSTEILCLKENCFNLEFRGKDCRIYSGNNNKLLSIIYDDEGIEECKAKLKDFNLNAVIYIFSLDDSNKEEDFIDIANIIEIKPIPASILNVYRRLFR